MPRLPRAPQVDLEITEELIADAVARDSSHCLWAEAVKAAFPGASRVSVDIQTIRFTDPQKGLRYTYLTPRTAQISLVRFDQGVIPDPHGARLRGGQVTIAGKRAPSSGKPLTDKQKEQRNAARKKSMEALGVTSLRKSASDGPGEVHVRTGGRTPPLAAGKRRAFGLKGLEY